MIQNEKDTCPVEVKTIKHFQTAAFLIVNKIHLARFMQSLSLPQYISFPTSGSAGTVFIFQQQGTKLKQHGKRERSGESII